MRATAVRFQELRHGGRGDPLVRSQVAKLGQSSSSIESRFDLGDRLQSTEGTDGSLRSGTESFAADRDALRAGRFGEPLGNRERKSTSGRSRFNRTWFSCW